MASNGLGFIYRDESVDSNNVPHTQAVKAPEDSSVLAGPYLVFPDQDTIANDEEDDFLIDDPN